MSAHITEAQLDELEQVLANAPPGPWLPDGSPSAPYGWRYAHRGSIYSAGGDGSLHPQVVLFILAAVEHMPSLIQEVRRLTAEVERLTNLNKTLRAAKKAPTLKGK